MATLAPAVAAPFFDRLESSLVAPVGVTGLDSAGLQRSLIVELTRLFNTRSALTVEAFLGADLSVIDYGLPDLGHLSALSESDLDLVRDVLIRALSAFEPRLSKTVVLVQPMRGRPSSAFVRISAAVAIGKVLRRVEFDLAGVNNQSSVEVRPVAGDNSAAASA